VTIRKTTANINKKIAIVEIAWDIGIFDTKEIGAVIYH